MDRAKCVRVDGGAVIGGSGRADGDRLLVSLVVPCFNEEEVLPVLVTRLREVTAALDADHRCRSEIILVDDGSRDRTWELIREYAASDTTIRGARFTRNFGQQAATLCGYRLAQGDAVIGLDADLQDPPEVISQMVERWRSGVDVVYAVRRTRHGETPFKRLTAKLFYCLIRRMGASHIRHEVGDFRLISRRALDSLLQLDDRDPFLRGMIGWLGFPAAEVLYDRQPRAAGHTKWLFHKMLRLAFDAIVSSSRVPLRWGYYASLALSVGLLTCLLIRLACPSVFGSAADTAMLLSVVGAFGATTLLGQAVLGEYVGRIHSQCVRRPRYVLFETVGFGLQETREDANQRTSRCG